jgi:hypothetical protein
MVKKKEKKLIALLILIAIIAGVFLSNPLSLISMELPFIENLTGITFNAVAKSTHEMNRELTIISPILGIPEILNNDVGITSTSLDISIDSRINGDVDVLPTSSKVDTILHSDNLEMDFNKIKSITFDYELKSEKMGVPFASIDNQIQMISLSNVKRDIELIKLDHNPGITDLQIERGSIKIVNTTNFRFKIFNLDTFGNVITKDIVDIPTDANYELALSGELSSVRMRGPSSFISSSISVTNLFIEEEENGDEEPPPPPPPPTPSEISPIIIIVLGILLIGGLILLFRFVRKK